MSNVNIFTDYSQKENRFTNGLFSILSIARAEHPEFVSGFFSDLLGIRSAHPFNKFRVLREVAGTVDADVRSDDTCILFETKIESIALRTAQIASHLEKLRAQSEPHKYLVLLTPDDGRSNYISLHRQCAQSEILQLGWNDVHRYLRQFVDSNSTSTLTQVVQHFLATIHSTIFENDVAGIIQTIKLGETSGVFADRYLDEMNRGVWKVWHTPREYPHLSGTCRILFLYDPSRKAITVEVEIAEVKQTDEMTGYPWSNVFVPETLWVLEAPISRDAIRLVPGLERFGIGPAAYRRITHEQYSRLNIRARTSNPTASEV